MFVDPLGKPVATVDDWKTAVGESKWKPGNSAERLASTWLDAGGFPPAVQAVFGRAHQCGGKCCTPDAIKKAVIEFPVQLDGLGSPSINDIYVEAHGDCGDIVIMVEGKKSETFGDVVADWLQSNVGHGTKKPERLTGICDMLGLHRSRVMHLRYQLLHRTASAIIQANKVDASNAIVLVHSFSKTNEGYEDYCRFLHELGLKAAVDELVGPAYREGVAVCFAWVKGG